MKMQSYVSVLIAFIVVLTSCKDVIEVEVKKEKDVLIVEGWITDTPDLQSVKLYKGIPYFNKPEYPPVHGAILVLTDDTGLSETLTETGNGEYEVKTIKPTAGHTYTLTIHADATEYKAITELKRVGWELDSVKYDFKKKSALVEKEGFYPKLFGQESAGSGDFNLIKIRKNGNLLLSAKALYLVSDEYTDGNYINNEQPDLIEPFAKGDNVSFEVWSLNEDAFNFWQDLQTQLNNGDMFASPAMNTRTNIVKISGSGPDVTGYFGASSVKKMETVVK